MKIALRAIANAKAVSMWDSPYTLIANRDHIGPGEEFEMLMQQGDGSWVPFAFPEPPPPPETVVPPTTPTGYDPAVRQPWPRPMPPDIDTADELEVTNRVDWCLQSFNSSDDRSYWVNVIMGRLEELHQIGWTADGYWRTEKMAYADGNGQGYVWPPR
jgi:hypothetical protein